MLVPWGYYYMVTHSNKFIITVIIIIIIILIIDSDTDTDSLIFILHYSQDS
jgi:hypothetical protein